MRLKSFVLRQDWFSIMGYSAIVGLWADAMASYYHSASTLLAMNDLFQRSLIMFRMSEAFLTASQVYGWISVIALAIVIYKSILKWQIKNIIKKYHIDTI